MILQPISIALAIGLIVMLARTTPVASSVLGSAWERLPMSDNIEDRRNGT